MQEGDQVRVIVRCEACRHRWTVILPAADSGAGNSPG